MPQRLVFVAWMHCRSRYEDVMTEIGAWRKDEIGAWRKEMAYKSTRDGTQDRL